MRFSTFPSRSTERVRSFMLALAIVVAPTMRARAQVVTSVPVAGDTLQLSLTDAVTIALRQSDEVGIAAAQVSAADALYGVARANLLPQLRFSGSYLHVYESARGQAVGAVFNQPNTYTGNLNLSQTLFQGGRLINATRAAEDVRQAARFDEREQRALVTVQVQSAYLQALYTARLVELQERNLALATARLTQVEQFERAGRAARYDVLRARVERSNIEPVVIQARSDAELAILELKRTLNLPVTTPVALVTRIDADAAAAMLGQLADTTLAADRAAIRSAELNAAARRLNVKVARADFFPTLTAFFQSGYQAFPPIGFGFPTSRGALTAEACPVGSTARTCQNGGWFSDRQAGLNISLPVFDGFRIKSNLDLAQAQARLAELQLSQVREAVSVEVARARAEQRRANAVFTARHQTSLEAEEAFQLAQLRFARGLSTQLEVSDAQLALLTAQSTEARATYDLFLSSAGLARSLGRPIPLPVSAAPAVDPRQ